MCRSISDLCYSFISWAVRGWVVAVLYFKLYCVVLDYIVLNWIVLLYYCLRFVGVDYILWYGMVLCIVFYCIVWFMRNYLFNFSHNNHTYYIHNNLIYIDNTHLYFLYIHPAPLSCIYLSQGGGFETPYDIEMYFRIYIRLLVFSLYNLYITTPIIYMQ